MAKESRKIMSLLRDYIKYLLRSTGLFDKRLNTTLIIDIIGSCNLKCPSCPMGSDELNRGGRMSIESFGEVVEHAVKEFSVKSVALFNWTDPTIVRNLSEYVSLLKRGNLRSRISTNLSHSDAASRLIECLPDELTISLSGFSQEVYSIGHRGGDINIVKRNMTAISQHCRQHEIDMSSFNVYFHIYNYNRHEVEMMKIFANGLGFTFGAGYAYYMPIERVLKYKNNRLDLNDKLYVDSSFEIPISRILSAAESEKSQLCSIQHSQIVINSRGELLLCCGVYSEDASSLGPFLSLTRRDIFRRKNSHNFCRVCKKNSLHHYINWYENNNIKKRLDIS